MEPKQVQKHLESEQTLCSFRQTCGQNALGLVNTAVLAHSTAHRVRRANQDLPKAFLVEI